MQLQGYCYSIYSFSLHICLMVSFFVLYIDIITFIIAGKLQVSNAFDSSLLLLNPDISEAQALNQMYVKVIFLNCTYMLPNSEFCFYHLGFMVMITLLMFTNLRKHARNGHNIHSEPFKKWNTRIRFILICFSKIYWKFYKKFVKVSSFDM